MNCYSKKIFFKHTKQIYKEVNIYSQQQQVIEDDE